jgi:hypothetical protein
MEEDYATNFLVAFTRNLISAKNPSAFNKSSQIQNLQKRIENQHFIQPEIKTKPFIQSQKENKPFIQPEPKNQEIKIPEEKRENIQRIKTKFVEISQKQNKMHPNENETFSKIANLLKNYSIQTIECAGPDKNVLVEKFGKLEPTPIILEKEEIDRIIKELSDRTKIPVINGIFKATTDSFNITAVISEFVGTRFIINKK